MGAHLMTWQTLSHFVTLLSLHRQCNLFVSIVKLACLKWMKNKTSNHVKHICLLKLAHLCDLNCNLSPNPSKYESVIYPPLEHLERTPRQFVTLLSIRGAEMGTCGLSRDIIPHQGSALPYNPSSRAAAAPQSQKCSGHRVIVVARVQNIYKCIIFASLD